MKLKVYRAIKFRCECGNDTFVHEGSDGSDGFSCWWNGFCQKCKKAYEVCETTEVELVK